MANDRGATQLLLYRHKAKIVRELNVARVLPQLVKKRIFTYVEEREILKSNDNRFRADIFVDRLAAKGPDAFREFCVTLERTQPRLLKSFIQDNQHFKNELEDNKNLEEKRLIATMAHENMTTIALKDRDSRIEEELESMKHELIEMKAERDRAFSALENIRRTDTITRENEPSNRFPISNRIDFSSDVRPSFARNRETHGKEDVEKEWMDEVGEKVVWENHTISLTRVPNYGFGIAVTGGRDNPHFMNGDPAIVVSDVLKGGPAESKLMLGDRILSVNHIQLENVDHSVAITVLKDSPTTALLVVRRRVALFSNDDFEQPFKVTLNKKNKKIDYGIILGYKLYIKEILSNGFAAQEGSLKEGDDIVKVNNTSVENLSLNDAKKQMEKSKDKLQLIVTKTTHSRKTNAFKSRSPDDRKTDHLSGYHDSRDREPGHPHHHQQEYDPHRAAAISKNIPDPYQHPVVTVRDYRGSGSGYSSITTEYAGAPLTSAHPHDDVNFYRKIHEHQPTRVVSFVKEGGVGIRVIGGNRTGIFVTKVAPNTPAERQGLIEGDLIIKVNDVELKGKTREESVLFLLSLRDHITLLVQHARLEYDRLMSEGGTGDLFYIRTHFNYDVTEHGEMSFKHGDVFQITDTLYSGVVGSWQAIRVARTAREAKKGIIPNLGRAEQLSISKMATDKENLPSSKPIRGGGGGSSFFRKKVALKAKSLGKENWDDVVFGGQTTKFPAYERVILKDVGFVRPVVIFGSLADVARDKLVTELPEWFELPKSDVIRNGDRIIKSGIIRLGVIRDIIDRKKHSLLDVTPNAVDRLNFSQFAPIVIFVKAETKHSVKELRQHWSKNSAKSPRKLFEQEVQLEKSWSHIFTHTIALTNGEVWYKKLKDAIEKSQLEKVWMSELKLESFKDDILFPMTRRLSFVSSPESDMEPVHGLYNEDEADLLRPPYQQRLIRSTSDPSLAAQDNIPGNPTSYYNRGLAGQDVYQPHYRQVGDGLEPPWSGSAGPLTSSSGRGGHPIRREFGSMAGLEDRPYNMRSRDMTYQPYPSDNPSSRKLHSYGNRPPLDLYYRMSIDPYATLTPSERIKYQTTDAGRRYREPFPCEPPPLPLPPLSVDHHHQSPPPPLPTSHSLMALPHGWIPSEERGPLPLHQQDANLYSYRMEPGVPAPGPSSYDKRNEDKKQFMTGFDSNPVNRHDDSKLQERFGMSRNHDDPPQSSNHPNQSTQAAAVGTRRNEDVTSIQREEQSFLRHSTVYPFAKSQSEAWRAKSETNLNRKNEMSSYSPVMAVSTTIQMNDRNMENENMLCRQNYENRMRNQFPPYSSFSSGYVNDRPNRDSLSERSSSYLNCPRGGGGGGLHGSRGSPSQGDHLPLPKPPHLLQAPSSSGHDRLSAAEVYRNPDLQEVKGYGRNQFQRQDGVSATNEPRKTFRSDGNETDSKEHNSAFESYRKPDNLHQRDGSEDNHTIVATARGVFDSNGGILESKETGVAIVIPNGAIPEGVKQEIYFKVCQDNNILPPLDKDKGETLLSPLVMCGPHGLTFLKPVELCLPHSASVNPESWSFALKSSDSPTGHPTHWQNISLAGSDGRVSKNSVAVLVDHF